MILVSDTSVLIDLERGSFLEVMFALPYEFAVPDVLYHREMKGDWGDRLVKLGLRIEEVSKDGVATALKYRSERRSLSVPDSFALALAKERAWTLLTGDGDLRDLANGENVGCHGVLVASRPDGRSGAAGPAGAARWAHSSCRPSALPPAEARNHSQIGALPGSTRGRLRRSLAGAG